MRPWVKIAIAVLVPVAAYFAYDSIAGHWLVRQLCAKDGGLRIHETMFARGFLDESLNAYSVLYCSACFEQLAKQQFEYIDIHVPGDPATAHPLAIRPGYYRLSLASRGDTRCERWKKNVNLRRWDEMLGNVGRRADQCVAVDALSGRPAGAVLSKRDYRYARAGRPRIYVRDISIDDISSGREVARLKDYYFVGMWSDLFNFGPARPTSSCDVPLAAYVRIMAAEPLRDVSRKSSSESDMESLQ